METKIRVLVIEDDPSLCDVLETVFSDSGYEFRIFEDISDICSEVGRFRPDVVLLDYLLPSTNGGEICNQLKSNVQTAAVPVIIYSALPKALLPLDDYQCNAFIEKPFDLYTLLEEIERQASPMRFKAINRFYKSFSLVFKALIKPSNEHNG